MRFTTMLKDSVLTSIFSARKFSSMNRIVTISALIAMAIMLCSEGLQAQIKKIPNEIKGHQTEFATLAPLELLEIQPSVNVRTTDVAETLTDASFFIPNVQNIRVLMEQQPTLLKVSIRTADGRQMILNVKRAKAVTDVFRLIAASNPDVPYPYQPGLYYWGMIEGQDQSLVALAITEDEIMGFIQREDRLFTLGRLDGQTRPLHVLYATDDLRVAPDIVCHTDDHEHNIGSDDDGHGRESGDKCVRMYIEVDYDIFVGKGGMQQAADYVLGAFSQVAIMYANDDVELVVNEIKVWNVADPYTGPSTSNYLTQFRDYLNGNYNGDLAHLVGYNGGGGIAYLNVLCNSYYGVGYSAINASYNNVPTYSWTIMVLTHEIGHNLGSQHTHACAWNGNNTAIDGCGPQAGYSEGCNGPIPTKGTVMSYCHLIGGVGIDLGLGFGPQPADRIRTRITNAACLANCGPGILHDAGISLILEPGDYPCENQTDPVVRLENFGQNTLTSVTINYQVDNDAPATYSWTGNLVTGATQNVMLPGITYGAGGHTFTAWTSLPNGQDDEVPSNDASSTTFTYIVDYCACNAATAQLQPNPLTHVGGGSSSASVTLEQGSKNVSFLISGLSSKTNGSQQSRYIDRVIVTYTDGNGNPQTYGTFFGNQQSSVQVSITGFVNAVQVSLSNSLNNNYNGTLSISFGTVDYCSPNAPCADADGDGVCNEDDLCPGFDDNQIGTSCDDGNPCTTNDIYTIQCICEGTPIPGCEEIECNVEVTSHFPINPLTHAGAGSSSTTINFPPQNANVSFTIHNLNAKLSGNPGQRFDDQVTVSYTDGFGTSHVYGVFLGSQTSSVSVAINGYVQSVTVSLANAQNTNVSVSVTMTAVTSCVPGQEPIGQPTNNDVTSSFTVYPNPTTGDLYLQFSDAAETVTVRLYNPYGMLIGEYYPGTEKQLHINLRSLPIHNQWLFLSVQRNGNTPELRTIFLVD